MKPGKRLILRIILDSVLCLIIVVEILFGYPYSYLNSDDTISNLWVLCGPFAATHHKLFFCSLGLLIGGIIGGLVGSRTWPWRFGFGCALLFIAGIALGIRHTLVRTKPVVEANQAQMEFLIEEQTAFERYLALKSMDEGTNALEKFRIQSRAALTNFLLQADQFKGVIYGTLNTKEWVTNSGSYTVIKKYLAEH
ncbi:MAG TPA: hypothetical protein VFM25_15595 [Verrucomicrobiae bacterium]|nr:hypothetical protein [Verrucomicrobiae bacterium]